MTEAPEIDQIHALLGNQIGTSEIVEATRLARADLGGWHLDDLQLTTTAGEVIPAYFLHPPEGAAPVRAVLYCHAHGNTYTIGREELIAGRPAFQAPYAADLVAQNTAALCLEMPCFGERASPGEGARTKAGLWASKPLFGQMLAELAAGLNWLAAQVDIDESRLGVMGLSMGGTHAWWLGALAPQVKATVSMCCFADLETLVALGAHDGHGIYMMVPGLFTIARSGQIAGLTAPRAQLVCAGMQDWSTPPEAFEAGLADLVAAYETAGTADMLETHIETDLGHAESAAMRARVLEFLDRRL
ncbi:prolyl oligopeptidase family serine peptidase [Roseobacter sp. HKCCD9010]|uniref:alpha/beta hydrolase family protein n=1 Tax=unclassified Roseobacter TaxID=196798 RepID=UPI001491664B|nr:MULTISPECIES: prolyl oligopeptidase family serine peptidase [unclassified Roseobacter]MBF9050164.1 prolyl oligopeptidase family serine peptidase [Rhodobacterales bacterium HKCCD4356]NNV12407.1 prolyl oligopeptidase family serine peptidase [Roseobacter sp. HKCCD7357]NNV16129.1 prolyl oligopeptidase family serine peptidase [Roseobacter sp. HKCCD8768]NNV25589.1 prolyl oligopeptidase family serine peptidase [Roseobacter sp. HKCCD8192]NNV29845.1 prolyl oligopeptidase family serine peptidase [Ros